MAIGLGRTIGSPVFLFVQIVYGVSLFFLLLGLSRVVLGVAELTLSPKDPTPTPTPFPTAATPAGDLLLLHPLAVAAAATLTEATDTTTISTAAVPPFSLQLRHCFHVPLLSLFNSPVAVSTAPAEVDTTPPVREDGSAARFYLQHVLAAVLCATPLATLLQRRKFVLDFVVTIYVIYWLFTDVMLQAAFGGGTLHWWGAWLLGAGTMYAATYMICRRKEMQEVKLSGGGGGVSTAASCPASGGGTTTGAWRKDGGGDDAREMEEVSRAPAFHDAFTPSGAAAVVSSAMATVFYDATNSRGRAGLGVTSPQPVALEMGDPADEGQFKSKSV